MFDKVLLVCSNDVLISDVLNKADVDFNEYVKA